MFTCIKVSSTVINPIWLHIWRFVYMNPKHCNPTHLSQRKRHVLMFPHHSPPCCSWWAAVIREASCGAELLQTGSGSAGAGWTGEGWGAAGPSRIAAEIQAWASSPEHTNRKVNRVQEWKGGCEGQNTGPYYRLTAYWLFSWWKIQ